MVSAKEPPAWVVDLKDVRKTFGKRIHALRGVDIQVGRGEIFGLLGPNGAGKSTLVRIIMTIVRPNRAAGSVLGAPLGNRRKLARIGYLPESHRFPGHLKGGQLLNYYAALGKVPRTVRRQQAAELLERMGLSKWARTRISKYSKGMLQRLGLAQALMNDPELVFLDEPTDGLDPIGRRDVRQILLEMKQRGKTVFLNSHLLSELEMICDRVAILVQGRVARQGTIDDLTKDSLHYRITVGGDLTARRAEIESRGGKLDGGVIQIPGQDVKQVNAMIDLLRKHEYLIESVAPHRFTLEDIFVQATQQMSDAILGDNS